MTPRHDLRNDRDAQVGIGTMIVFIATILVAAVAAGVLIDTSQKLQDKSTQTGTEAINNVGTSLTVLNVWGDRGASPTSSDLIDDLYVDAMLASGAADVDLNDLVIHLNDGSKLLKYTAEDGLNAIADNEFFIEVVRDEDGSLGSVTFDGILTSGDIVRIKFGQYDPDGASPATPLGLTEDTKVDLNLAMSGGSPVSVGFATPMNYGTTELFELF